RLSERFVYCGAPGCGVAAETPEIAERALKEVRVEYEQLPNVLTVEEALKEDSTPIHPGVVSAGSPPYSSKNVCSFTRVHRGNPEKALAAADHVVEESYETQQVHQSYLEPRAATADVEARTGRVRVWTSTQSP